MEKLFFDVFPSLDINQNIQSLFAQVTVPKVSVTSAKDYMRVYLKSEKLIHKKYINEVEQAIKSQLFLAMPITIKIIERFNLSQQYTPEKLLPIYKDSILLELKDYSIFEYNLFRQASCEFPAEDTMKLTMENSVVAEGKSEELVRVLEKIFCERCGMSLKIQTEMKDPVESKARKNSEIRIRQEVEAIMKNVAVKQ